MSHEFNPEESEQPQQEAKKAIDSAVPVFADIARSYATLNELNEQLGQAITKNSAVVELDGDYFEIAEETHKGDANPYTNICIERLTPTKGLNGIYSSLLQYRFSSNPTDVVIKRLYTVKNKYGQITAEENEYELLKHVERLFSQMYNVDDQGMVHPEYTLVSKQKADKLRESHRKQLALEFDIKIPKPEINSLPNSRRLGSNIIKFFKR